MAAKKIRFGIVGVGGMGSNHCNSFDKVTDGVLAAVCDYSADRAKEVGEKFGIPHFSDYVAMYDSGLVDAVLIATPHPIRPPIVIAAMERGIHVLSEKPLSEKVSSADTMLAAAETYGVSFAVMFQRRTEPVLAAAIKIAQSGKLGKIHRVTMISPEFRSQAYYDSGGWRATWKGEGGGVMMNQSPHILDLFIQIGGMPKTITARVETRMHHIEVEDIAEAMVTYEDGGSGYFYCSTNEAGPGQMIEVFGDKGKLCYRNGELKMWKFTPGVSVHSAKTTEKWGGPKCEEVEVKIKDQPNGHWVVTQNFARHLLKGTKLIAPAADGLQSLELANAAWLSSDKGKPVEMPISRTAYDRFLAKKIKASTFVKYPSKPVAAKEAAPKKAAAKKAAAKKKTAKKKK